MEVRTFLPDSSVIRIRACAIVVVEVFVSPEIGLSDVRSGIFALGPKSATKVGLVSIAAITSIAIGSFPSVQDFGDLLISIAPFH